MRSILKAGLLLGALTVAWTFVMGFTGWYKHPALLNLFWVVIPIEIGVLVWALRRTRDEGRAYGQQVLAGTLVAAMGSVLIFAGSLTFTSLVFPRYFEELRAMHGQLLRDQGLSEDQIKAAVEAAAAGQTALVQAVSGVIGTVVTGVIASLIIAAFVRAPGKAAAS